MAMAQTPSMGRIVHYVGPNGTDAYPAIIRATRELAPDVIDVTAFTDVGTIELSAVPHSDPERVAHSWHWPERT